MDSGAGMYAASRMTAFRLTCKREIPEEGGIPLLHPAIIPAWVLCIVAVIVVITGCALKIYPLAAAAVIIPLAMAYCGCFSCCYKKDHKTKNRGNSNKNGHTNTSYNQDGNLPTTDRKPSSPKRIGKKHRKTETEDVQMNISTSQGDIRKGDTNNS